MALVVHEALKSGDLAINANPELNVSLKLGGSRNLARYRFDGLRPLGRDDRGLARAERGRH